MFLMDTEGLLAIGSDMKSCTKIFALSCLMSSVTVYNLHRNINQNDLDNLQVTVEKN